jgi:hypothetical protein
MRMIFGACALGCSLLSIAQAEARVRIGIDLSSQTMHVNAGGASYDWPVSTARSGYATPRGHFRQSQLQRMHYSHKYHMSPMPYSIFFNGGYAIHGTYSTADLGRPASHGCIRLSPGNAALLFSMVKAEGADITISGTPPRGVHYARPRRERSADYARLWRQRGIEDAYAGWPGQSREALAYAPMRRSAISARTWRIMHPVLPSPLWDGWSR